MFWSFSTCGKSRWVQPIHVAVVDRHEEHAGFDGVVSGHGLLVEELLGNALGDGVLGRRSDVPDSADELFEIVVSRRANRVDEVAARVPLHGPRVERDSEGPPVFRDVSLRGESLQFVPKLLDRERNHLPHPVTSRGTVAFYELVDVLAGLCLECRAFERLHTSVYGHFLLNLDV